ERPLAGVFGLQLLDFLFVQFRADSQPRGDDARQTERELPVQVDIHPVGRFLLRFDGSNLFHKFWSIGANSYTVTESSHTPEVKNKQPKNRRSRLWKMSG